jgi:ParB family chromosome partitioning protein
MSSSLIYVLTDKCDYPSQPRSNPDPAYCRSLGESMKAVGQQVPIIGYTDSSTDRFNVADGGCRLIGAKLVGVLKLLAMDLGKKPTQIELLMAQAAIDIHKQHLPAMDRARLWQSNIQARGCTARQMAKELAVSDSLVGDYLSLLTLPPDVQEQVNSGELHMSKACLIAQQEGNPDRQRELAALAKNMARNELAARMRQTRRNGQQAQVARVSVLKCPLPSGTNVVIKGRDITLESAIVELQDLIKAMKKAIGDGIDSSTFSRVCRAKAKAARGSSAA